MIPVDQTLVDKGIGDCHRACVASILELDIEQVPNFRLFDDKTWFNVYYYFLYCMGWEYHGYMTPSGTRILLPEDSINGYFDAIVPSKTFDDVSHAVVVDTKGIVVHDPNPNKLYQDENVLQSGALSGWYMFEKVKR